MRIIDVPENLRKYYYATVRVSEDACIAFSRDRGVEFAPIEVFFVDDSNHTTTKLASAEGGKWNFTNYENSTLFWRYAKPHGATIRRVMKDLKKDVGDVRGFGVELNCARRRWSIKTWKMRKGLRKALKLPKIKFV